MRLPTVGELFQGRYEIQQILGRGGFAQVYRAHEVDIGRDVAIKVLLPSSAGYRPDTAQRFTREARVIANLQDPHTITMFEFGRSDDGLLFMVFEYVDGVDLAEVLRREGALATDVVVRVLRQLLEGLAEAHQGGVLHRDIKPPNVILFEYMGDRYNAKLIDFGIAKPLVDLTGDPTHLTRDGMVVGTPRYMAPEQFFGDELTPASDMYSLGLLTHEMMTGVPAIAAEDPKEIVRRQISADPIAVPTSVGTPEVRAIVDRMTAREPAARFPTAAAVLAALDGLRAAGDLDHLETAPRAPLSARLPQPAAPPSPDEALPPRTVMAAWLSIGVIAGLAFLGVAGIAAMSLTGEDPSPQTPTIPAALTRTQPSRPSLVTTPVAVDAGTPQARPEAASTDGCGRAQESGYDASGIRVGLGRREWTTYVPRGYDAARRHPVVLMFHRTSQSSRDFMVATAIEELADAHDFVALSLDSPESSPWEDPDDPKFVALALEATNHDFCIDRTRLYVMGDGSGGRLARELPCQLSVSAVATTASGQYPGETICRSTPPTPFIRLFGKRDLDVPAKGGRGCLGGKPFMSARDIEAQWRKRNGCSGAARPWFSHSGGHCRTWQCEAPFVSCGLDGGHDWNTAPPPIFKMPNCAAEPAAFPFGETIWRFFEANGRTLDPSTFGVLAQPR